MEKEQERRLQKIVKAVKGNERKAVEWFQDETWVGIQYPQKTFALFVLGRVSK